MKRALPVLLLFLAVAALWPLLWAGPARAACRLSFTVTDLNQAEDLKREFGPFVAEFSRRIGCKITLFPAKSRTAAVQAMKAGRVDLALTGPAEYVVFRKLSQARPLVAFSRPDYCAGIIVMADSGIHLASQLKGKKVVFGDVGSTSGHLAPMQIMADHGLDPLKDIHSLHMGRFNRAAAWEMLKMGQVDAIALSMKQLLTLRGGEKTLPPGAFRMVARGPDLPNDVLLAGPQVEAPLAEKIRRSFMNHPAPYIAALVTGEDNHKYLGAHFLTHVKDEDYNYVRRMYRTIGFPAYAGFVGR